MPYQAFDLTASAPVAPARDSLIEAKMDANHHKMRTGQHAYVQQTQIVWTTQTICDLNLDRLEG